MAYTDRDTVRQVLAPDGVTEGTAASLEDSDIDEAIERVSNRVDTFLTRRYTVPLADPVPGIIRDIATDIAAYDLTLAYYKGTDITDQDPVVRRYRDARGMLGQLGTGLLVIDVPGADQTIDDPVVINPEEYQPRSPGLGFEVKVIREFGPWEYR
jgi:phage gp36-like protein